MRHGWLAGVIAVAACGGGGFHRDRYVVQFPSARLAATRPGGAPWHVTAGNSSATIIGGLVGLAIGYPGIGLGIGAALSDPGGEPRAPTPYIEVKLAGTTYRISPIARTYAPAWTQPFELDARQRTGDEQVVIQVLDGVDNSVIAQHETTLAKLVAAPAQTLTQIGAVMSLDVRVKPAPARQPLEFRVTVPSQRTAATLAASGAEGWQPIPVWNGDTVQITATGSVCPSRPTPCFGPRGAEPGRWERYSYDEFHDVPHASLIGIAPGQNLVIGDGGTFHMTQAGRVVLFVNDTDVGNNEGAFEVRVVVTPAP